MTNQYYAEEIGTDGRPVPVKYHGDYPAEKTASGKKRRFHRAPVKLHPDQHGTPLSVLRKIYGSGTEAAAQNVEDDGFITVHGGG